MIFLMGFIGIDPGHGGKDYGSIGPRGNKEKDIVLNICLDLAQLLKAKNFDICMTRNDDSFISMLERIRIIKQNPIRVLVSLHLSEQQEGINVFVFSIANSENLAIALQKHIQDLEFVKKVRIQTINRSILRESTCPSVVVELGSFRNVNCEKVLSKRDIQLLIAQVLANGIEEYLNKKMVHYL